MRAPELAAKKNEPERTESSHRPAVHRAPHCALGTVSDGPVEAGKTNGYRRSHSERWPRKWSRHVGDTCGLPVFRVGTCKLGAGVR